MLIRLFFTLILCFSALITVSSANTMNEQKLSINEIAVLDALLGGDRDELAGLFQNALACEAADFLLAEMTVQALYQSANGSCQAVDMKTAVAGDYFSDTVCIQNVKFKPTSFEQYCQDSLDKQNLGNAALITGTSQPWTLSPGARMNIGIETLADKQQPYSTRTSYKTVTTTRGQCSLEMRVYKNNLASQSLKPLLAFHGGSWRYRGGFIGIESQVAHFTEKGFIVFTPFYRLIGETEGNPECTNASAADIVQDAADALAWVKNNGASYGASTGKVALMGQSAGAHLSAWLAVHRPEFVERALLLYPPTDFKYFISQLRSGEIIDNPGTQSLEGFLGESLSIIDLNSSIITENSFPSLVESDPKVFPPLFMIHGSGDELVPANQSSRLCNALSGSITNGPVASLHAETSQGLKQEFVCGDENNQFHSVTAANHVLDLCLYPVWCPAGNLFSQAAMSDSLKQSREWLTKTTDNPITNNNNSSGGGGFVWLLFPLFFLFLFRRVKQ